MKMKEIEELIKNQKEDSKKIYKSFRKSEKYLKDIQSKKEREFRKSINNAIKNEYPIGKSWERIQKALERKSESSRNPKEKNLK
jgi:hypothetical protein